MSVAVRVTFLALLTSAPSSIAAVVTSRTMLIAAPAPMPTVLASLSLAIAFAVVSTEEVADCETSPAIVSWAVPVERISALVSKSAIVSASEPAMPTLPAPPPAVASVSSVLLPSGSPLTAFQFAASACGAIMSFATSFRAAYLLPSKVSMATSPWL